MDKLEGMRTFVRVVEAGSDNAAKSRAVIVAVKAKGIPAEQIATSEYNLYPEYDHQEQPRPATQGPRIIGYVANNTVRIEVRRLDQVGPVIDAALAAGANMVNTIQFFASNVDVARRTAMAEAVGRARGDAEALARAAGGSLGALLELNTQAPPVRPMYGAERLMRMDAGVGAAQTPIEPGQQTLADKPVKGASPKGKDTEQQAYELFTQLMGQGIESLLPVACRLQLGQFLGADAGPSPPPP